MYAPALRKMFKSTGVFIERSLPSVGVIYTQQGYDLKPFDRIGDCLFSHNRVVLPENIKLHKDIKEAHHVFIRQGELIGLFGSKKLTAPFDGYLDYTDVLREFVEVERKHGLLSGVWGTVDKVIPNKGVLLKTNMIDIIFAESSHINISGEMVVFPNPMDILEEFYLESYLKNPVGKVVYMGDYVKEDVIHKAIDLKVGGVICGSTTKHALDIAIANNFALGIVSGFGKMTIPNQVFEFLNKISYRQVFFQGERNLLRVPVPPEDKTPTKRDELLIKKVEVGDLVQVFQKGYFGKIGTVDRVTENSIFVKFSQDKGIGEIFTPNFFILSMS
jgi:hypothetical protein